MTARVLIRSRRNRAGAVIAAVVLAGIGGAGLWLTLAALPSEDGGVWVMGLLAPAAAMLWAVVQLVWAAFGVALVISAAGIRKAGPFGSLRLPREGLRLGRHDARPVAPGAAGPHRARPRVEIWALSPVRTGAVLLWAGPADAPELAQIVAAAADVLALRLEPMTGPGAGGFAP